MDEQTSIPEAAVEAFREAWHTADERGEVGGRVLAGLTAAAPHLQVPAFPITRCRNGRTRHCPACETELSRTGITSLFYTFMVCTCGSPEYDHLVEQLWHRACLTRIDAAELERLTRGD